MFSPAEILDVMMKTDYPEFSIIIPVYNEEKNVSMLHKELASNLKGYNYELIYVNDGSTDGTYQSLRKEFDNYTPKFAKIINLKKHFGQTQAFKIGINNAVSSIVVVMDGDLQNDPADIPKFIEKIKQGYDLVQGVRVNRKDAFMNKVLPAKIANFILRIFLGVKFKDIGCSLKAFKKDLLSNIIFQEGIHRILPAYFYLKGAKTIQLEINHRQRIYGKSNYGLGRIFDVFLEVIKIRFFDAKYNIFLLISRASGLFICIYSLARLKIIVSADFKEAFIFLVIFLLTSFQLLVINLLYSIYIFYKKSLDLKDIQIEQYRNYNES